jgi:uncharacterized protein YceK
MFSKYAIPESQLGNYYSGTKLNISEWRCYSRAASKDMGYLLLAPLIVPIMVVDLPLSMIGDTLLIPVDAMTTASHPPLKNTCAHSIES